MKNAYARLSSSVLTLAFFCLILIGCGQKGPLYLPQPEKPVPTKTGPDKPKPDNPKSHIPQPDKSRTPN